MMDRKTLSMIAVLATGAPCFAQTTTAEAFFNQASKEYVKQDKMQALRTLDHALQQYPGDPRLLKLAEELVKEEQQKQQQEQQKQEQRQTEEEKKEQEKKDEQQAQDRKEQEKKDHEQAQDQQKKEQEEQGQEQQQQNGQEGVKGQPRAGTIAPQDAMRMLDALERSEKDVQEKVRVKMRPASRRSIQKDW